MRPVYVCGLPRCGATLLMTMLAAGGLNVLGLAPDFEVELPVDALPGVGVKCLSPMVEGIVPDDALVIRLRRNIDQQLKSQIKLLAVGDVRYTRAERLAQRSQLRLRESALTRHLRARSLRTGVAHHELTFELLLKAPAMSSWAIAQFLDVKLDTEAMAECVIPRPAACRPNLQIERLLEERAVGWQRPTPSASPLPPKRDA